MSDGIDTTLVECPEGCDRLYYPTTREFSYVTGETGRRNYCRRCGSELVEADDQDREVIPYD